MALSTLFIALAAAVAGGKPTGESGKGPSVKELRAAPSEVKRKGVALKLQTYLWRDFMPISPPGGKPLIAALKLRTAEGMALPEGIRIERVWVLNGDEVWAPAVKTPGPDVVVRDGPKWGPGIQVDVVVQLPAEAGATLLLRAAGQPIQRTD
jgi:hypothetical protein